MYQAPLKSTDGMQDLTNPVPGCLEKYKTGLIKYNFVCLDLYLTSKYIVATKIIQAFTRHKNLKL